MENQEVPAGYKIDGVTGYLESIDGTGIQPKHKTAFLKAFRKSGDKTLAITHQGFRYLELDWHFHNDAAFKLDFKETLLAMKHEIESIQFENAAKPSGHRDRQIWLETNFPEEYGKKTAPKGERSKSRLDTLLEDQ